MPLTQQEAAQALKDITRTERRSVSLQGYRMTWPHLVLWGVIWFIGYGAMAAHVAWPYLWLVLSLAGSAGSFFFGYRLSRDRAKGMDWRYAATFFAIFLFIAALFAVMPPQTDAQYGAFFPILVSLYYALIGIWTRGLRMLVLGILLAAITIIGFFYLRENFELLMALVGGGGLILGGLWLRSA
ncbi:MAG: hypothetical protein JSR55_04280 [Proteobacteria bacterium]|nr:hypothetical protein [Pseudomonadota bacterium]